MRTINARASTTSAVLLFTVPVGGEYTYIIATTDKNYEPSPTIGSFIVHYGGETVNIKFFPKYSITFKESGLPPGTEWFINLSTVVNSGTITNLSYTFSLENGTYSYTIATADRTYKPFKSSGTFTVNGTSLAVPINFTEVTYSVTFIESGLSPGPRWYVNLSNSQTFSSKTGTISFSESNGTYSYTIATSDKTYKPLAYSGSFTVNATSMTVPIIFSKITYQVIFVETNLPSGSTWYVNLSNKQFYSSTTDTISFYEPNGTYSYAIVTSDHTYKPSVSSGSFEVNGSSPEIIAVAFKEITYSVTFTESGLSSGTSWSVTLNGTTLSSKTSTITFALPNGTYSYTIGNVSGYNISKSSGSLTISGNNLTKSITFSQVPSTTPSKNPPSPSSSNTDLYIIIGAVSAVAVAGAVVTIMLRKKK